MKKYNKLILLTFLTLFWAGLSVQTSHAATSLNPFGWWSGQDTWEKFKNYNPYLEKGKDTQNQQWAAEDWYVQDWVAQNKDGLTLIDGFFRADILREQADEKGMPVIYVGPQFYRLGGFDKRRVMTTLDAVYAITENPAHPTIFLKDWMTKRDIGIFTKEGLQLE